MLRLLKLGARNLARNRRRTLISLIALIVGVGVMVALRGFINGQQRAILENVIDGNLGAIQVHKRGYLANVQALPLTFDIADSPALRAQLAAVPGVTGVAPRITFGAMVSTPDARVEGREPTADEQGRTSYFAAIAIDPQAERKVTPKRWSWVGEGRMFDQGSEPEIVLNADFNEGLAAQLMPQRSGLPPESEWAALLAGDKDGSLNGENVRVVGTQLSASPGDKRVGLVPLGIAQKVLRMEGRVTEYGLSVTDLEDAPAVKGRVQALLGPSFEVSTWDEIFPFIKTLVQTQNILFGVITAVFLLIVLLGIVNTLLMSVMERVREIGTMLAVGMRRSQIVLLFLLEGLVLGLVGGALGASLGYAVTLWLHQRGIDLPAPGSTVSSLIRPFVAWTFLLRAVGLAALGSGVAALYPAYRASKLRPVEALAST